MHMTSKHICGFLWLRMSPTKQEDWFPSSSIFCKDVNLFFNIRYLQQMRVYESFLIVCYCVSCAETTWTKLYQKPRYHSNRYSKQTEFEIMLRPRFPPVFRESQMPDASAISEVVVIVNDAWKVGDLVDWWKDECYWSGKITRTLEDGKLQVVFVQLFTWILQVLCFEPIFHTFQWNVLFLFLFYF